MNDRKDLSIRLAAYVLMLALAVAVPAGAVTHYVSPGQSIQAAIDDANDGEEIEVAPGTYNEAINFKGKAVRLYSSGGPEVTTIDANGLNSSVVTCNSSEDVNTVLEGFTITGGNTTNGGGMYNSNSSPTVTNCTFSNNTAGADGGGMYNLNSNPVVTDCTFSQNTAGSGGAGGGIYNEYGNVTVTNCTFRDNTAGYGAGIFQRYEGSLTVTNCAFISNSAGVWGGGMYSQHNNNSEMTNCTFGGNSALGGGGIYNYNSSPTVTNCILWGDTPNEIVDNSSTTTVTYSDVQGGWGGAGNINNDPCFVDAAGGDLRLSSSISPCVDAGDNNTPNLPVTDLAGNPRVVDGDGDTNAVVDMGAYELQSKVHNITKDLWYGIIQTAIDDANDGDEIEVGAGTYNEAIDFNGKAVRLYSSGGPDVTTIDANGISGAYHVVKCISGEDANTILEGFTITGGNANGPGDSDQRGGGMYNYYSSPTVTNCIFSGNSADYKGGGMSNSYSSPTVTNCNFGGNSASSKGGGMYNEQSSPTVTDCNFTGNSALDGGGMHTDWMNPTVANCTFSGNSATYGGGGMNNNICSPTVTNCTFIDNEAGGNGGGMHNNNVGSPTVTNCTFSSNSAANAGGMYNNVSSPTVTKCTFSNNTASNHAGGMYNNTSSTVTKCIFTGNSSSAGGGMFNGGGNPVVTNCIFSGNSAGYGAGMWNYGSSPTLTNCTFSTNVSSIGGGMYNEAGSNPTVTNCILWGDTSNEIINNASSPTVAYSDVQGGWPDANNTNIDVDPFFVDANHPDPNLRNLWLKPDSPCIDAGDTTAVPGGTWADLGGNPRVLDDPQTPDTGVSLSGLTVDMGAYEFYCSGIPGDINCDGAVDFKDVAILCNNWLAGTDPEL